MIVILTATSPISIIYWVKSQNDIEWYKNYSS